MTMGLRKCTFVLIPNGHKTDRDILAFSGLINDDDDYYFDDPLFPRIDEDLSSDMNEDGKCGIAGIDDDGDGLIDETVHLFGGDNDDEGSAANEDDLDGIDNDGDGSVDEDYPGSLDGIPGIPNFDDDGDGLVDEGGGGDDDEDGHTSEVGQIPVLYLYDSGTDTIQEVIPFLAQSTVLSTQVTHFWVEYLEPNLLRITLELTGDDGQVLTVQEEAFARNVYQRTGKRVR
jgi:hypothetical protein